MTHLNLILMVAAFICFVLSSLGIGHPRVNLQSAGLALWVLTLII
jgi:hypothetical protein